MNIGYGRVSTSDQNLDLQLDALKKANCEKIYTDVASGAKTERDGLRKALDQARDGDVLVVWRLDRLGRSLPHLLQTVTDLNKKGIGFRSLTEQLDTTTPAGMLIYSVFGAVAEFERNLIRERTQAGLKAARARGRLGGRPKIMDKKKAGIAASLYADGKTTVAQICETLKISRATFYRNLNQTAAA